MARSPGFWNGFAEPPVGFGLSTGQHPEESKLCAVFGMRQGCSQDTAEM